MTNGLINHDIIYLLSHKMPKRHLINDNLDLKLAGQKYPNNFSFYVLAWFYGRIKN